MKEHAQELPQLDFSALRQLLKRTQNYLPPEDQNELVQMFEALKAIRRLAMKRTTDLHRLRHLFGLRTNERTESLTDPTEPSQASEAPVSEASDGQGCHHAQESASPTSDACEVQGEAPCTSSHLASPSDASDSSTSALSDDSPSWSEAPESLEPVSDSSNPPKLANDPTASPEPSNDESEPKRNHGRRPASAFTGAVPVFVPHPLYREGDPCPHACGGKLRKKDEKKFLRLFGQAVAMAQLWRCERLRCNGCQDIFTAKEPPEAQGLRHEPTVASIVAYLHYGAGMPFNRLERIQENLGVPLPKSTQWQIVNEQAACLRPVYEWLQHEAAQGTLLHSDDTSARIFEHMGKARAEKLAHGTLENPERTGIHTTGIVAQTSEGKKIALFRTGRPHAGENLGTVFEQRAEDLPQPTLMTDALAHNRPKDVDLDWANCWAHGRRGVFYQFENHPEACKKVLKWIGQIFRNDKKAREQKLSDQKRLEFHQHHSQPVLNELHQWIKIQFDEKRIEENSGLGKALQYLLKHWKKLTLFLRKPGVPLDNNICERALKFMTRYRKNSLFYRTQHGADVGDAYMSLIHTAELCGANPFEYLTELQKHREAVAQAPEDWLPWNYKETLSKCTEAPKAAA